MRYSGKQYYPKGNQKHRPPERLFPRLHGCIPPFMPFYTPLHPIAFRPKKQREARRQPGAPWKIIPLPPQLPVER